MKRPGKTVVQIIWLALATLAVHLYFFPKAGRSQEAPRPAPEAGEKRLRNLKQLTSGGENAEAYWSPDGSQLIFQSTRDGGKADQIYVMKADGTGVRRVSNGTGRTTCAYFLKDGRVLYASTHHASPEPPPPPDFSQGYVWGVYPTYDLFTSRPDGSGLKQLTTTPGYDAEATVSRDGERIIFTSMRDGDLDLLHSMKPDGSDLRRLTNELGYDGGAFYPPDGKQICYRAYHPKKPEEVDEYRRLLRQNLVKPSKMEIFVADADGSNRRQLTRNGAANFCPYFTPDGKGILFASNMDDPQARNFELYLIRLDGTGLERVTTHAAFDGFPMFSPDGKRLVWASNRNAKARGETNLFVADWVP